MDEATFWRAGEGDKWFRAILGALSNDHPLPHVSISAMKDFMTKEIERARQTYLEECQDNGITPDSTHPWGDDTVRVIQEFCNNTTPHDIWVVALKVREATTAVMQEALIEMMTGDAEGFRVARAAEKAFQDTVRELTATLLAR